MNKVAFVFPGQGSQYVGMGKDFYDTYDIAKKYFSIANDVMGFSLSDVIFNGSNEDLKKTEIAQPAIYVLSMIIFNIIQKKNISPAYVAGHSLGEYTALTASGMLDFIDALKLVVKRGQFLKEASNLNQGSMVAVLGLDEDIVLNNVNELRSNNIDVEIANYNSPSQIVLSYKGNLETLNKITEYFLKNDAKKMIPLNVSGPFHSSFMTNASFNLSNELHNYNFSKNIIPIIFNYNANVEYEIGKVKDCIINQVNHPVKWVDTINLMIKNGVTTIIEIGPGKVLTGLNKKIDKNLKVYNIDTTDSLDNLQL